MNIPEDMKKRLKEQRLNEYLQKMFTLEMDIVALKAIGDVKESEKTRKTLESVKKAYQAVEVI